MTESLDNLGPNINNSLGDLPLFVKNVVNVSYCVLHKNHCDGSIKIIHRGWYALGTSFETDCCIYRILNHQFRVSITHGTHGIGIMFSA